MYKLCEYDKEKAVITYHAKQPSSACSVHFIKKIGPYAVMEMPSFFQLKREHFRTENIHLSNIHFQIEDHVLTDLSRNGTYVNGKKVSRIRLSCGDQISVSNITMYYLGPYLVSDEPFAAPSLQRRELRRPVQETVPFAAPALPVFEAFESFMHAPSPARSSLLMALAPSFMILSSTGISLFVQHLVNPENFRNYAMMSMSSLFMSFSFFALGLVQHTAGNRQAKKAAQKRSNLYKQYVSDKLEQYENTLCAYRISFERSRTAVPLQGCAFDRMPIALKQTAVRPGNLPGANYETRTDPLYEYVKKVTKEWTKRVPEWEFLQPGAYVRIGCEEEQLLCHLSALANAACRILRIVPEPEYDFLHASCIEAQYLSFPTIRDALAKMNKETNYWIVARSVPERIELPDNCTVICCSRQRSAGLFDQHIDKPYWLCTERTRTFPGREKTVHHIFFDSLDLVQARKEKNDLQIVIGTNGPELTTIDLRGAHLLVAGMTGSGKSEFLSALLLYCVVYFSSRDVQYVLIDFKGGAFGNAFYEFPHCAGQVTNLQEDQIERFMVSLQSEIVKRQKKLADFQKETGLGADIEQYRTRGEMSHLLIVVDEFAQLKLQYPAVMNDLKEYARIGRSLGIHLILATQKPAGIVDEQIWSNSKYRICLKVNSAADSREVLSHDKASRIRTPGTFYIQESEGEQICARSFYVHASCRRWNLVNEPEKGTTILESMKAKVKAQQEQGKRIIQPPLGDVSFDELLLVDRPRDQAVCPFLLEHGQQLAVYAGRNKDAIIEGIAACFDDVLIEHVHFERDSLWFLLLDDDPKTIVLDFGPSWHDCHGLLHKKNIRLIYLFTGISLKDEPILSGMQAKCCADHSEPELVRSFFNTYIQNFRKDFPMTTLSLGHELFDALWTPKRRKTVKTGPCLPGFYRHFTLEEAKNYFNEPILGYDEACMPIFWNKKKKLLVCYEDDQIEELLYYLVQVWKQADPFLRVAFHAGEAADVLIVHMRKNEALVQSREFRDSLYSFDVMWAGEGFGEYAYTLKKRMVACEGSLIVFQENKVQCGSLLSIHE